MNAQQRIDTDISDFDLEFDNFLDGTEIIEIHDNIAVVGYLCPDYDPFSPREDPFSKMVYFDTDYLIGDEQMPSHCKEDFLKELTRDCTDFAGQIEYWEEYYKPNPFLEIIRNNPNLDGDQAEEAAEEAAKANIENIIKQAMEQCILIPYNLYTQSYHILRPGTPGDLDIEGYNGVIYATPEMIIKEYGENTPETREKALRLLKAELEEYALYISGEAYNLTVETFENVEPDPDGPPLWEQIDIDNLGCCLGHEYAEEELKSMHASVKKYALEKYGLPKAA